MPDGNEIGVSFALLDTSFRTVRVGATSVTALDDGEESLPDPTVFVAFTVNVYEVLALKPVQLYVVLFAPAAQTAPNGVEVTVYPVIAEPPFETGAVNETVAVVDPVIVAETEDGAPGLAAVTRVFRIGVRTRLPIAFVAVIFTPMYLPTSSPVSVYVLDVALGISTQSFELYVTVGHRRN